MPQKVNSKDKVRNVIRKIYDAFEKLDAKELDQNFIHSDELIAFGTDENERFVGWDSYKNVHALQFRSLKKFKFMTKELDVHVNGNIAWISDRPHWEIETKEGQKIETDVRISAVLRKDERRRWHVVQWHVSVGLGESLHKY